MYCWNIKWPPSRIYSSNAYISKLLDSVVDDDDKAANGSTRVVMHGQTTLA